MKEINFDRENNLITVTLRLTVSEFNDHFVRCNECDALLFADEATEIDGAYYCEDCTFTCDHCGEVRPISESHSFEDSDEQLCDDCFDETYTCAACGRHFLLADSIIYREENDSDYCRECYEDRFSDSQVESYHTYKDSEDFEFMTVGSEKRGEDLFLGVELEIDSDRFHRADDTIDCIESIMPAGFLHYEHDGSLSDEGIELISSPASAAFFRENRPAYEQLFAYLTGAGYTSHDNGRCGMHFHLDEEYFGANLESGIAKMLYLFSKYENELIRFSRRNYTDQQSVQVLQRR